MSKNKTISESESEIPQTPFAFFLYVSKPFKYWAILAIVFVVFGMVINVGVNYLFKLIIDSVEVQDNMAAMKYALLYPGIMFIGQVLFRCSGFFGMHWVTSVRKNSYDVLSAHTLKHSHSYFSDRFAGSLMSKINNVAGAIDRLIPELLWTHLTALLSVIITLTFLVFIDSSAAAVFLSLVVALFIFNKKLSKKKRQYSKQNVLEMTRYRGYLVDVISNIQAVRQYVKPGFENESMRQLSTKFRLSNIKSWFYTEMTLFWNSVIILFFSSFMFWLIVAKWQEGIVSTGELILVIALYSQIISTLMFIGRAVNSTANAVGEIDEGLEELLIPTEINDDSDAIALVAKEAEIDWKNVGFEFSGQPVFSGFDLNIPAGQRMGLVGKSGAGKSTFVSLLLRQHDIETGSIEIDGQNISKITQDSLRQNIAVVPQEPALFHRSIRENILYGKPDATEEELITVAKQAQAYGFIMALPEGFETMVGERGVKLSGGQKQRVAIARAMLKDAPILVLDEATSALDSESEVAIQKALETLMEGRTVIAIAHRLSTLRKMDRIIVMEAGKIIEDGDHNSLSQSGGVYEKLWNHQAGGFLQE
jgi:ATP-binding cassette subfamily B protein